jgi:hypothetical protein
MKNSVVLSGPNLMSIQNIVCALETDVDPRLPIYFIQN